MSKPKFKVGDRVRILDGSKIKGYTGGWFNHMARRIGEIATIKCLSSSFPSGNAYHLEEFPLNWDERGLELVKPEKIIIYRNGAEIIAKNTATGKTGVARCNPADEFDFNTGAKLAFERLTNSEPEKPKKPKYYTGKVVCVSPSTPLFTKGKVYEIKDGVGKDDVGNIATCKPVKSFEEFSQTMLSKFIELVE